MKLEIFTLKNELPALYLKTAVSPLNPFSILHPNILRVYIPQLTALTAVLFLDRIIPKFSLHTFFNRPTSQWDIGQRVPGTCTELNQ